MVTKLLSKIYLPRYHSLQDTMEDEKSRWSCYYQDKKLSHLVYDSCAQRLVNWYSVHDKEMIKRTMLEHEAIFRRQVCELHRLYRIQQDLMNGLQNRVFHRSSIPEEGSYSTSFLSQRQSECTEKISPVSPLPLCNTSYNDMPFAVSERLHFSFKRKISVQSDQIEASPKDTDTLDCKLQQRRTCCLQLPADVCENTEETDRSGQLNIAEWPNSASTLKNGTSSLYFENDMKLSLVSGHRVDHQLSNSAAQISRSSCCFVDLNKPTTETCNETPASLASDKLLDSTHSERNRGHHSSLRSNANFMDRHADQKCPSDILLKNVYTKGEWGFFNFESGNGTSMKDNSASTFYKSNVPKLSETFKLNANACHEYFPSDHDNPESWSRNSRQKPTHEMETSPRFHHAFANSSLISPSMPSTTTSLQAYFTSHASPLVSSWRKPSNSKSNIPVAVCALRCFDGSAILSNESLSSKLEPQSPISYCQKWQSSRNLTTNHGTDTIASHTNALQYNLHLDSNSLLYPKVASCNPYQMDDGNGNLDGHFHRSCLTGSEDSFTFRQDSVYYGDVNNKVSDGSSWLKKASSSERAEKTAPVGFSSSSGFSKLVLSSNTVATEKVMGFSACNQQEVASSLTFRHHKIQGNEVSDSNRKQVVGFLINSRNGHSSLSFSERHFPDNTMYPQNDNLILAGLSCDENILNSQKIVDGSTTETCGAKSNSRCRNHINLNVKFSYVDDSTSLLIGPQDEVHIHSSHPITIFGAKIASGTDLEAPVSQAKMDIVDQHKEIYSSSKVDSEKKYYSCDTIVKSAAENLVAISKNGSGHQGEIGYHNLSLPQFETLCWFAEVVSCSSETTEVARKGKDGDGYIQSSQDDKLDLFEVMTLKLQEMQVDQYWCSPEESVGNDDREPTGAASVLDTKHRRGQARKRRRRRDFQTDILPALASLARHEVAEDLQIFGEMMEIAGRALHTCLTRKQTSRHGVNFLTKGRRKSRRLAVTVEEVHVTPHQHSQHNNSEKGCSMIAWGRTTRRCRRQRSFPGSLCTPAT